MALIAVIGAGVVGLTTALKALELGFEVVLVAELFPGDEKNSRYASNWASAILKSARGEHRRQEEMSRETFDIMWKLSEPGAPTESLFLRVTETELFSEEQKKITFSDYLPNFRYLSSHELPLAASWGVTFDTVTIDVQRYLQYLYSQIIAKGGRTVKAQVQHITQVAEGAFSAPPDAVVVCPGLGARFLGGVEDKNVYPISGQTILVHAPWVKFSISAPADASGLSTYVTPRPGGNVILGGTRFNGDWYPKPRPEIAAAILQRALTLVPELAPPHLIESGKQATVANLEPLVIEDGCGLRPARTGGMRLESDTLHTFSGKRIPVVYNYGHGAQGYLSSWGSAAVAAGLLKEALQAGVEAQLESLRISH